MKKSCEKGFFKSFKKINESERKCYCLLDTFLTPRFYYFYGKHFKIINYTTPSQQQHDKLKKKKLLSTNETWFFFVENSSRFILSDWKGTCCVKLWWKKKFDYLQKINCLCDWYSWIDKKKIVLIICF